ncbi:MAG: hypothetical protein KC729_10710, partial [Candidatus Eisenbacteria bacterium]|nr:hypothetical protein [Candidatus Eisenbacteria bacterium]
DGLAIALAAAREDPQSLVVLAGSLFTLEDGYRAPGVAPRDLLWGAGESADGVDRLVPVPG